MGKDISGLDKLNIGCGKAHMADAINLDISGFCNPDIQHDIRNGLPFEDNRFSYVRAWGVLEMILPNEEFRDTFNEIWRVLKPDGVLDGVVPSINPEVLMLDPFDRRWFQESTFQYLVKGARLYETYGTQYGFNPWHLNSIVTNQNGIIQFNMTPAK